MEVVLDLDTVTGQVVEPTLVSRLVEFLDHQKVEQQDQITFQGLEVLLDIVQDIHQDIHLDTRLVIHLDTRLDIHLVMVD